jgi:hypothetical protein
MISSKFGLVLALISSAAFAVQPAKKAETSKSREAAESREHPAVFYDFKGARLGMTLADWKTVPAPIRISPSDTYTYLPLCAGEPTARLHQILEGAGTSLEKAANVRICGYYGIKSPSGRSKFRDVVSASVPIGELSASNVYYKFLDDKLYEIVFTDDASLFGNVNDGLVAKWGEPTSVVESTIQNQAGATFPHVVKKWENPMAFIRVEMPSVRVSYLTVRYGTTEGAAKLTAIEEAINPDAEKM